MTPAQAAEARFAVFAAPKWGFRALAFVQLNYARPHGLKTVRQIISRWAPPGENDTEAFRERYRRVYSRVVAKVVGAGLTPL